MIRFLLPALLAAPPPSGATGATGAPDGPAVKAGADAWHQQRIASLTAEDGWLTLVNLAWLEEGESAAGSREGAAVHLPAGAPAALGTFRRAGDAVSFSPARGVAVTLDGEPFTGGAVRTDRQGKPDVLRHGTLQLLVIQRGARVGVRVRDSAAPARTGFRGIDRFPVAQGWLKEAKWEPAAEGRTLSIPNVIGDVSEEALAGTAVFTHGGKTYRLDATREGEKLFFVFGDLTNRDATYGAGRFLYTGLPAEGRLTLDFNRAYNPPCAFTAYATCPLPPPQNKLGLRVEAGEQRHGKK